MNNGGNCNIFFFLEKYDSVFLLQKSASSVVCLLFKKMTTLRVWQHLEVVFSSAKCKINNLVFFLGKCNIKRLSSVWGNGKGNICLLFQKA